jgi:hypothetical protein
MHLIALSEFWGEAQMSVPLVNPMDKKMSPDKSKTIDAFFNVCPRSEIFARQSDPPPINTFASINVSKISPLRSSSRSFLIWDST